ncbi:MAG: glutathione-dependent reductase [Alphaproteobacteria bacterium]|nr:glutathione-dependent reductase [Alphaproteobacteria bacterium]MEC7943020.1 glutathione S-transferase family protein [Pseudomonadota bacterium]MEC8726596.1 glutathione S-transferase family protein [Pseudomonadota bacterium]
MGMLIEGQWIDDDEKYRNSTSGTFVRPESSWRDTITADGSSGFKAEPDRYHLFLAPSCPWAHRTQIIRRLKGLEKTISATLSDRPRIRSWAYTEGIDDIKPVEAGVLELHEIYIKADPNYTGRVTVPTLWDRKTQTIVNNESAEIIRMLNSEFDEFAENDLPDLYPVTFRALIDELNDRIYKTVNNGVYRCGFAKTQEAYNEHIGPMFETFDHLEELLSNQRYLITSYPTEADWRLFVTLIRFDFVYFSHFKCNIRRIQDYPNLWNYTLDLYQTPGLRQVIDIDGIKRGYYGGQSNVNPSGVVPTGPIIDLTAPHNRELLL